MSTEYLFGLNPENFRNRVKSMTNAEYNAFLKSVNTESKARAYLFRFGNTTNSVLKTRKNRLARVPRKLLENARLKRATARAATGINKVAVTALTTNQGYTLGRREGGPSRETENAQRKARDATRPPGAGPLRPTAPSGPKGVATFANLVKKEGKQVFINISFVPAEGIRNYTQGIQGETIIEKKQVPLLVQSDAQKGPTFMAEMTASSGQVQYIIIPSVIPSIKDGKIVSVPLSEASPVLDSQREPKKQTIQHTYHKNNAGIFSVSYEANMYKDSKGDSFFYYLNLPEITEGGNNGLVMYDAPFLPAEFILEKR